MPPPEGPAVAAEAQHANPVFERRKVEMQGPIQLHATRCAICETEGNSSEVFPATFQFDDFNPEIFSARRIPDRIHYRMVRCKTCGLLRADPVGTIDLLSKLYAVSSQSYDEELSNLKRTYSAYLARLDACGAEKGALLEIGCGSGFFLEEALEWGYADVAGVEPSVKAVAKADSLIRTRILCDTMRPQLFPPGTFDAICMFQVFDHIPDPNSLLAECHRILKPGGLVLSLNHDAEALSARLLGERSPIVDIEHTYLYSKNAMRQMFSKHGFVIRQVGSASNEYSLSYLVGLLPMPRHFKASVVSGLRRTAVGRIRMSVRLGNLFLIAQTPSNPARDDA